jgi:hypothetical protein
VVKQVVTSANILQQFLLDINWRRREMEEVGKAKERKERVEDGMEKGESMRRLSWVRGRGRGCESRLARK